MAGIFFDISDYRKAKVASQVIKNVMEGNHRSFLEFTGGVFDPGDEFFQPCRKICGVFAVEYRMFRVYGGKRLSNISNLNRGQSRAGPYVGIDPAGMMFMTMVAVAFFRFQRCNPS